MSEEGRVTKVAKLKGRRVARERERERDKKNVFYTCRT